MKEKTIINNPSHAAFDAFFQNIPVPIFLIDDERRICNVTRAARTFLSEPSKDASGRAFGDVLKCFHSLENPLGCGSGEHCKTCLIRGVVIDALDNGRPSSRIEAELTLGKEKICRSMVISVSPVELLGRRMALLHCEDITELKETKEALEAAKDNLTRAQAVARIGSWHLDIITNKLAWSDETLRIFGFDSGTQLSYEKFLEIVHPDDRDYVNNSWQAALQKQPYDIEHRIIVGGKIKWVREKAEVEFDNQGKPISGIGTVQEITGRKEQEKELHLLRQELMHVSRVTAMGELTAALAHELNQPLMAIMSNAQAAARFLNSKNPDLNEIREIIADIVADDRRASKVINKLRALLKKSEFEFSELDINDVIREVIPLVHSDIVIKSVSFDTYLNENMPPVHGDRIQLQQVLLNLVLNSLDAVSGVKLKRLFILTEQDGNGNAVVTVADTGKGINDEYMKRLFDPFFTTKKEGMGMGLAINKAIIEAHSGTIWAENVSGGGAAFSFSLPLSKRNRK
ncbi:MAG: hypothetical protein COV72_06865 [Candidatus Omnitrophica bacterium CG11_big_fil_rev_8_21_14_0_20_42_13]|uniref:histidine kinase n=1 Tax=Candidatus Ghiorseimicrobium undicola TaxID=1974746 RepID=A0A2H0LWG1_9BACT|nr:MAG: hypothetical protein COV72_06865 [Candidatus Omnitrophica bacterium CG11_big_fil_rev_8_21_14_0_20_42_13]